jgi:hypothetical protein
MASQTKRKHSKAYNTEELFDLVDNLGNNNKKEEVAAVDVENGRNDILFS